MKRVVAAQPVVLLLLVLVWIGAMVVPDFF